MTKRTYPEVRQAILHALKDGKDHAYGNLERKTNTNWQTVRNHCKDLELFGLVLIDENGVKITKKGLDFLTRH